MDDADAAASRRLLPQLLTRFRLTVLPGRLAICRLGPEASLPPWADGPGLVSITRTAEELSIVCASARVPADVQAEPGWRAFMLRGPIPFSETGVLAALVAPLATAAIPVFAISTFDTDYVLVQEARLDDASGALGKAGYEIA